MEYPFLSIQKGRKKPIRFNSPDGRVYVDITGGDYGIATIWDWDFIIYLSAHINDGIESGRAVSQWVEFAPYDALRYMGRGTGGKDYKELVRTIRRLFATNIVTSIRLDDTSGAEEGFKWIEKYRIPNKYSSNEFIRNLDHVDVDITKPWQVCMTDWVYNSIIRRNGILSVHPDYFDLTGGLERWLYRLARKAVPDKEDFPIIKFRMETLHKRSGSTRPLRNFAVDVRSISLRQPLPEYSIDVHKNGSAELVSLMRDLKKRRRLPRGLKFKTEDQRP